MTLETLIIAAIIAAAGAYLLRRFVWRRSCCNKPKPKRTSLTVDGKRPR